MLFYCLLFMKIIFFFCCLNCVSFRSKKQTTNQILATTTYQVASWFVVIGFLSKRTILLFSQKQENMISLLNFHFQLWMIISTFLVCFGSNQCPATIQECNAMYSLQTSFNLPTSTTNATNNQTNPCSNKKSVLPKTLLFAVWFSLRSKKTNGFDN